MAVSKVILNGTTLIDVTDDTVASSNLLSGYTATGADGETVSGAYTPPEPNIGELDVYPTEEEQTFDGYSHSDTVYISKSFRSSGTSTLSPALIIGTKYWVRARIFISDYNIRYFSAYFTASSTEIGYYKCGGLSVDLFISNTSIRAIKSDMYDSVSVDIYEVIENKYDGYNPVTVHNIPNEYVGSSIPKHTSSDIQISGPNVTIPNGYYSLYASVSIPAGTASVVPIETSAPQSITFNSSTGLFSASFDYATRISPAITSGYISSGTSGIINVYGSSSFQLSTLVSQTIIPGTSDQTISAFNYLIGSQTIKGDANLIAPNIRSGISIFGIQGTLDPGGGGTSLEDALIVRGNLTSSYTNTRVTYIGSYAFASCAYLPEVNFPNVTNVGIYAFWGCSALSKISFPALSNISPNAFSGCGLRSVYLPSGGDFTSIWDSGFYQCGSLSYFEAPNFWNIGNSAFAYCSSLQQVSFQTVRSIGGNAFARCSSLSSVYAPELQSIGYQAFVGCSSLTNISFPKCTSILAYAFSLCTNLGMVSFPSCNSLAENAFARAGVTEAYFSVLSVISNYAFISCSILSKASFPACTSVGQMAFGSCYALTEVYLPICRYIGANTFSMCSALPSISLPSCSVISTTAFYSCSTLSQVYAPLCNSIGSSAFCYTGLLSADFPECTYLGSYAFAWCSSLEVVSLAKLSRTMGYTFRSCSVLREVYLESCASVGIYTFHNCINLTEISLPNCSVILDNAFDGCSALSSISLPVCSNLRWSVFINCTNLSNIYLLNSSMCVLSSSASLVFANTPILTTGSVFVPASLVDTYKADGSWKSISARIFAYEE